MAIRTLSVASGMGGLDLGIKLAEPCVKTVGYVERQAYCAATLVARMETKVLDSAPIWDDFTTLPGHWFSGRLDLVTAGIPCQPYSAAGRGLGKEDPRCLWSTMARFLHESGCPALFLENVSAFVSRGLPRVLGDLADLGFDAEWGVFSCGQLGAPHLRKRLFLLAYTGSFRERLKQGRRLWAGRQDSGQFADPGTTLDNPSEITQSLRHLPFWPPGQNPEAWRDYPEEFWPSTKRVVRRENDGLPNWLVESDRYRTEQLRALGNAVSSPVAAVAWLELTRRALGVR